jgi:spore germination protein YaaH
VANTLGFARDRIEVKRLTVELYRVRTRGANYSILAFFVVETEVAIAAKTMERTKVASATVSMRMGSQSARIKSTDLGQRSSMPTEYIQTIIE